MKISILSPTFSILINGYSRGFFKGSRGFRHGDPLSPYLFIIVADLLARMVAKVEFVGLVKGFPFRGGLSVPFIQFADNSLFILKANLEGMQNLRYILLIMEVTFGLKVN